MWLIPNYKHDIRRNLALRLIAFLLKCDFRARFPAWLHRYAYIFIFLFRRAIWLHYTSRYFHLFHTTTVNFFKRHVQIMLNRRILNFLLLERCVNVERMWPKKSGKTFSNEARNMEHETAQLVRFVSMAIIKFHVECPNHPVSFNLSIACQAPTYLNAVPRPWGDRPRPKGDEKKSSSMPPMEENKLLWWSKMLSESKKELNGLLVPKNDSKVALGSPWNSYVKFVLLCEVPFDLSVSLKIKKKSREIILINKEFVRFNVNPFDGTHFLSTHLHHICHKHHVSSYHSALHTPQQSP